jgi:hypothetical protein
MFTITQGPADDMQIMIVYVVATVLVVFPCILATAALSGWLGQRRGRLEPAEAGTTEATGAADLPAPSLGRAAAA